MPSLMPCCQVPRINAEMHHHKQLFCTWGQATVCTVQAHVQEAPTHTTTVQTRPEMECNLDEDTAAV